MNRAKAFLLSMGYSEADYDALEQGFNGSINIGMFSQAESVNRIYTDSVLTYYAKNDTMVTSSAGGNRQ